MTKIRVVEVCDIKNEMQKIGTDPYGIRLMADKAIFRVIKVENVDNKASNILKQEMLSLGGEAATSREIIAFQKGLSSVLLMGTIKQFERLIPKLVQQPFGLKNIGPELEKILTNYQFNNFNLKCGRHTLNLNKTKIMGILNVTPDSFSDGGKYFQAEKAVEHAWQMVDDGADIIDIGGESSRPGAAPVSVKEELNRVLSVIKKLAPKIKVPISIDTYKSEVAQRCLEEGATIINDISALRLDKNIVKLAAKFQVPVVLMHMQGVPRNMQGNPTYKDVISEIYSFFEERIEYACKNGIKRNKLIIDPGIGFGKTVKHNLEILKKLGEFKSIGLPLLLGPSRKSLIGKILNLPTEERLEGTLAIIAWAVMQKVNIIRVHDVKQTRRVVNMIEAIKNK